MAHHATTTRIRNKTHDFADFFRPSPHQPRNALLDSRPSSKLEVPAPAALAPSKKITTRIPFLGRARKKSTVSATSAEMCGSLEGDADAHAEQPAHSRPSSFAQEFAPIRASTSTSLTPSLQKPSASIGSKLAAHFGPTRSRKVPAAAVQDFSGALSPPSSSRTSSFDSTSSCATQNRSSTPRPGRPTITVSCLAEDKVEYKSPSSPSANTRHDASPNIQSETSPVTPYPPSTPSSYASSIIKQDAGRKTQPRSGIPAVKRSESSPDVSTGSGGLADEIGVLGGVRKHSADVQSTITDRAATITSLPRRLRLEKEKLAATLRPRIQMPPGIVDRRNPPPSFPLPTLPPSNSLPDIPHAESPPKSPSARCRAYTLPTPLNLDQTSVSLLRPSALQDRPLPSPPSANFDINTASRDELKQALIKRNQQYDELANLLLKVTDAHVAQISSMDKKISVLDREASRKDKEIKGLTWLVVNNRGTPLSTPSPSPATPGNAETSPGDMMRSQTVSSYRRRVQNTEDSGAESHWTSGAESVRGSGTSGTESPSSIRGKKIRRPFTLGETSYNLYRASTSTRISPRSSRSGTENNPPDVPYLSASKRASLSSLSLSPSPSSSTSSLLPPTPSPTVPTSSLSAIPETSTSSLPRSLRLDEQAQTQGKDHRASHRLSSSSHASSSTSASSLYGSNLNKRSRPPSIAQVLERSPIMEDVLEKLRPFGGRHLPSSP